MLEARNREEGARTGGEPAVPSMGIGCGAARALTTDTSESAQNQPIVACEVDDQRSVSLIKIQICKTE